MSSYVVAQLRFTDEALYRRYQRQFAQVFAGSGGKLLAADEAPAVLEGAWAMDKVVVMEFDTPSAAREFLESPAYQSISKDREAGAQTVALLVQGLSFSPS
jgi:uncharacterized protein (DUF1330 family)